MNDYLEQIKNLRLEEDFLKKEIEYAQRTVDEYRAQHRQLIPINLKNIKDVTFYKIVEDTQIEYTHLIDIVDDLKERMWTVQSNIQRLREKYYKTRQADYFRPMDMIDISNIIIHDGSIIGFKL